MGPRHVKRLEKNQLFYLEVVKIFKPEADTRRSKGGSAEAQSKDAGTT